MRTHLGYKVVRECKLTGELTSAIENRACVTYKVGEWVEPPGPCMGPLGVFQNKRAAIDFLLGNDSGEEPLAIYGCEYERSDEEAFFNGVSLSSLGKHYEPDIDYASRVKLKKKVTINARV